MIWILLSLSFAIKLHLWDKYSDCLLWMSDKLDPGVHLRKFLMYFNGFRWLVINELLTEVLETCLFSCDEIQNTNHEPVFWCKQLIHTYNLPVSQVLEREYLCLLCYMASVNTEETSLCPFLFLNASMSLKAMLIKKQQQQQKTPHTWETKLPSTDYKWKGVWYTKTALTMCSLLLFLPSSCCPFLISICVGILWIFSLFSPSANNCIPSFLEIPLHTHARAPFASQGFYSYVNFERPFSSSYFLLSFCIYLPPYTDAKTALPP